MFLLVADYHPGCSSRLTAPDAAAGKNVKCPRCGTLMTIPAPLSVADFEVVADPPDGPDTRTPEKPVAAKTDVVIDDDEDDRPAKKPVKDDEDRPRVKARKGKPARKLKRSRSSRWK